MVMQLPRDPLQDPALDRALMAMGVLALMCLGLVVMLQFPATIQKVADFF